MVRMTNLTERDTLPCPLTITPKVEGKCVWTNTSILEFIPSTSLQGATRYRLEVIGTAGLLHTLSGSSTSDIMTTPLRVSVSGEFSPLSGISLMTNVPVNLDNLSVSTELFLENGTGTENQGIKIESIITPDKNESGALSETSFTITPRSQSYTYNTNYTVKVHTTLKPKYGTEPLGQEVNGSLHTNDFVWVSAYQNILSAT